MAQWIEYEVDEENPLHIKTKCPRPEGASVKNDLFFKDRDRPGARVGSEACSKCVFFREEEEGRVLCGWLPPPFWSFTEALKNLF